jgi:hypothetical protein
VFLDHHRKRSGKIGKFVTEGSGAVFSMTGGFQHSANQMLSHYHPSISTTLALQNP